jgi:hypothetical protein
LLHYSVTTNLGCRFNGMAMPGEMRRDTAMRVIDFGSGRTRPGSAGIQNSKMFKGAVRSIDFSR